MPISDKQLAANRANAKKSTGPRTPKGKAVCAMNGFQHGFTGHATVMTDDDRHAQNAFVRPYIQALNPIGPIELQLAQTIALDNFRLNRLKAVEENMFAYGELGPLSDKIKTEHARVHHAIVQAQVFVLNDKSFNRLSLYEQRITRNIHKNLKLLREEQALRKREALLDQSESQNPTANQNRLNHIRRKWLCFFNRPRAIRNGMRSYGEHRETARPCPHKGGIEAAGPWPGCLNAPTNLTKFFPSECIPVNLRPYLCP